jgi:hypothetical protein
MRFVFLREREKELEGERRGSLDKKLWFMSYERVKYGCAGGGSKRN